MESFILQNERSFSKNVDELQVLVYSLMEMPVAICFTDTWLKNEQNSKIFNLQGYSTIEKKLPKKGRQGCIYKGRQKVDSNGS